MQVKVGKSLKFRDKLKTKYVAFATWFGHYGGPEWIFTKQKYFEYSLVVGISRCLMDENDSNNINT